MLEGIRRSTPLDARTQRAPHAPVRDPHIAHCRDAVERDRLGLPPQALRLAAKSAALARLIEPASSTRLHRSTNTLAKHSGPQCGRRAALTRARFVVPCMGHVAAASIVTATVGSLYPSRAWLNPGWLSHGRVSSESVPTSAKGRLCANSRCSSESVGRRSWRDSEANRKAAARTIGSVFQMRGPPTMCRLSMAAHEIALQATRKSVARSHSSCARSSKGGSSTCGTRR